MSDQGRTPSLILAFLTKPFPPAQIKPFSKRLALKSKNFCDSLKFWELKEAAICLQRYTINGNSADKAGVTSAALTWKFSKFRQQRDNLEAKATELVKTAMSNTNIERGKQSRVFKANRLDTAL